MPAPVSWTVDATRRWLRHRLERGPVRLDQLGEELEPLLPGSADPDEVIEAVAETMPDVMHIGSPLTDRADRADRADQTDWTDRADRADRADRTDQTDWADDESLVLLSRCLVDVVLLHRITAAPPEPVEDGRVALDVSVDLLPLLCIDDEPRLVDAPTGVELRCQGARLELLAPAAWVEARRGGWIGVSQDGNGGWHLHTWPSGAMPGADPHLAAAVTRRLLEIPDGTWSDEYELFLELVEAVHRPRPEAADHRARHVGPISEIVASAGRSMHEGSIGGPGTDWEARDRSLRLRAIAHRMRVSVPVAEAAMLLEGGSRVWESFQGAAPEVDPGSLLSSGDRADFLGAIALPGAVELVVREYLSGLAYGDVHEPDDEPDDDSVAVVSAAWAAMLETLRAHAADEVTRARIDWMRSRLSAPRAQRMALLEAAHRADRRHVGILDDLMWFAAVQAHDEGGRRHLDDVLQRWVRASAPVLLGADRPSLTFQQVLRIATSAVDRSTVRHQGPTVGRNDRCPCGSGRKYKQCHLGRPLDAALDEPVVASLRRFVPWAQALVLLWFDRLEPLRVLELGDQLAPVPAGEPRNGVLSFVLDADAFTPERVDAFLVEAELDGAAFPPGLGELMRSWAMERFRVCEVTDRVVGSHLMLRDVRTGDRLVVESPETSRHRDIGSLLLARVISDGEGYRFAAGLIPVEWPDRDAIVQLLDDHDGHPDGSVLADVILGRVGRAGRVGRVGGSSTGGPIVHNTDGDDLVFTRTVLRPADPTISAQMVVERMTHPDLEHDEHSGPEGPEGPQGPAARWHLIRPDDVNRTLRATISVDAEVGGSSTEILLETNSEARRHAAVALLEGLLGTLELVEEWTDSLSDVRLAEELELSTPRGPIGGGSGSVDLDDLDDEAIAEIRTEMARRWAMTPVPALGGITPEQAADDPTRRADLRELLRSYGARSQLAPAPGPRIMPDPSELAALLGIDLTGGR